MTPWEEHFEQVVNALEEHDKILKADPSNYEAHEKAELKVKHAFIKATPQNNPQNILACLDIGKPLPPFQGKPNPNECWLRVKVRFWCALNNRTWPL